MSCLVIVMSLSINNSTNKRDHRPGLSRWFISPPHYTCVIMCVTAHNNKLHKSLDDGGWPWHFCHNFIIGNNWEAAGRRPGGRISVDQLDRESGCKTLSRQPQMTGFHTERHLNVTTTTNWNSSGGPGRLNITGVWIQKRFKYNTHCKALKLSLSLQVESMELFPCGMVPQEN